MDDFHDSRYRVGVSWDKQTGCEVRIKDFPPLRIDMPIEHGGGGRYPCPHELLFAAFGSCFLGTFLVFKRQLRLQLQDLQISVQGNVDLIRRGKYRGKYAITGIEASIYARVKGNQDEERIASDCIRLTKEHCPINRALQKAIPIKILSEIEATPS